MASISLKGLTKSFNAGDDAPAAVSDLNLHELRAFSDLMH